MKVITTVQWKLVMVCLLVGFGFLLLGSFQKIEASNNLVEGLNENFDNMELNSPPPDWEVNSSGGMVTVENGPIDSSNNQVLKLTDNSDSNLVDAIKNFHVPVNNELQVNFDILNAQSDELAVFNILGTSGINAQAITVIMRPTGRLTVYDGSTERTIVDHYTSNTWYSIRIAANLIDQSFDIYINGNLKKQNLSFRDNISEVGSMRFNTTGSSQGTFYVDNVIVNHSIQPSIRPNLAQIDLFPNYRDTQVLFDADQKADKGYLAFPTLLKLGNDRTIISYKRGTGHSQDNTGADLETIVYNPLTKRIISRNTTHSDTNVTNQNPELVHMPNGDIYNYVDWQNAGTTERMGVRAFKSTDDGITFEDQGYFPKVGDYKYGYIFDSYNDQDTTYLLAMTFPELGGPRAVHLLKSTSNGGKWRYIKNLNDEFNYNFNESSITKYKNKFLIAARGDDQTVKLFKTDKNFNLLEETNLTEKYATVDTYIGRPSLFKENGKYYLLGRDISSEFRLKLYHVDPETSKLLGAVNLAQNNNDSYYAEHYLQEDNGETFLNVITYEKKEGPNPDIVRYEYKMDEIEESRFETNVFESNFDELPQGKLPSEWEIGGKGGSATIENVLDTDYSALKISDTSKNKKVYAQHRFFPEENRIMVTFSMLPLQMEEGFTFHLRDKEGKDAITTKLEDEGKLVVYDGNSQEIVQKYSKNVWQNVLLYINVEDQSFDVYINNHLLASDLNFHHSVQDISSIRFDSTRTAQGTVFLKNIGMGRMFSSDVESSVQANGYIDATDNSGELGEEVRKINIQNNWLVSEDNQPNGNIRINAMPEGIQLDMDMDRVAWSNVTETRGAIRGKAFDEDGKKYTVQFMEDITSDSKLSIKIWKKNELIFEAFDRDLHGNIQIHKP